MADRTGGRPRCFAGRACQRPRPSYQHDPQRVYGMEFAGLEVHFTVDGAQLTVRDITLL